MGEPNSARGHCVLPKGPRVRSYFNRRYGAERGHRNETKHCTKERENNAQGGKNTANYKAPKEGLTGVRRSSPFVLASQSVVD